MSVILGLGPLLTDFQDDTTRTVMRGIPGYVRRADGRVWYVTEYFNTSASSITAGDWVELDETDSDYPGMAIQRSTLDDARVVGVALETIAAGAAGPVLRQGVINQGVDAIYVKMTDTTVVGPVSPAASGGSVAYTGSGPVCGFNLATATASGGSLVEVRCLNPHQPSALGVGSGVDLNGLADGFILDADADTTISAPTDDQIDFEIAGADDFTMTANTFTALSGSVIATNTISETTAGSGVTVDGVLIKDTTVDVNGTAGGIVLDADADTHLGASTDDQIDITVSGAIDFQITANTFTAASGSTIKTDTIAETTGASGVTIDGMLVKDGSVQPGSITDPGNGGAIPVTKTGVCPLVSAGAETRTLAIPTFVGQRIVLYCDAYVGDIVVTAASAINVANNTIMTFGAVSEALELVGVTVGGTLCWQVGWNDGVGLS